MKQLLTIKQQDVGAESPTIDASTFNEREAEIIAELGIIVEFRDFEQLKQTSCCYLAKQTGKQRPSTLEEGELEEGMYEVKAKSLDDAITLLERDAPDNIEGRFIQRRDLCFLKAAKAAEGKSHD